MGLAAAAAGVASTAIGAATAPGAVQPSHTNVFAPQSTATYAHGDALLSAMLAGPSAGTVEVAGPFEAALERLSASGWGGRKGAKRMAVYRGRLADMMGAFLEAQEFGIPKGYSPGESVPYIIEKRGLARTPEQVASMAPTEVLRLLNYEGTKVFDVLHRMMGASGWSSVDDLFNSQIDYNEQIIQSKEMFGVLRDESSQQIASAWRQRGNLLDLLPGLLELSENVLGSPEDIEEYRQNEEARMAEAFERFDRDAVRKAQFGGYNPSAALMESARLRETGQNEALSRALMLIRGEQDVLSNRQQMAYGGLQSQVTLLDLLDPSARLLGQVPGFTEAGVPRAAAAAGPASAPVSPWSDAVREMGGIIGEGILGYQEREDMLAQRDIENERAERESQARIAGNSPGYGGG